jgi:hypothetical protein
MRDETGSPERIRYTGHTDRLRAGLTGLGLVVVVVILTAANVRPSAMAGASAPGGETLAVLGVAPSSDAAANAATPDAADKPAGERAPR